MNDLRDLYQETILDHGKAPRNRRTLADATGRAEGHNPLCGDRVEVFVRDRDGVCEDVAFEGAGCAICMASASMMTEALPGRSVGECDALFERFHAVVTGKADPHDPGTEEALGKLVVFAGVRDYPMRVKCATLAWHTLRAARDPERSVVTTE